MAEQTRRPSWGSLLLRLLFSATLYGVGLLAVRWIRSGALLLFFLATVAFVMTVVSGIAKLVDSARRGRSRSGLETEAGRERPAAPVEFFEVLRPAADGRCSDDRCPCPETLIPRGTGFLYVNPEAVLFRADARSVAEAMAKKLAIERRTAAQLGLPGAALGKMPNAVLVCEAGAKLRNLDLATASADAGHWWNTGLAPLRATPIQH